VVDAKRATSCESGPLHQNFPECSGSTSTIATSTVPRRHGGQARFILTVEAKDGQAGIHSLRWLLKQLGHRGLRCVDAYEETGARWHAQTVIRMLDRAGMTEPAAPLGSLTGN
jgi:hypothetical protein